MPFLEVPARGVRGVECSRTNRLGHGPPARVRQLRLHRLSQLRDVPGAVADRTFARERYRLRAFSVVNATEASSFLRGIGIAKLTDDLAVETSIGWFAGEGRDTIGRFSDSDFGYVRLKYYF